MKGIYGRGIVRPLGESGLEIHVSIGNRTKTKNFEQRTWVGPTKRKTSVRFECSDNRQELETHTLNGLSRMPW